MTYDNGSETWKLLSSSLFFWFERPGCNSLSGGKRARCFCQFSSPAPAAARHLHCNSLYATQELQVTSDSRRHLLSLVIVTSLHEANKNTCCTSTITCCGLPRGKGVGSMAQLMQESALCYSMLLCAFWVLRDMQNVSHSTLASFPLSYVYTPH